MPKSEHIMHKKIYNAAFLINVIFQSFFNLIFPMAGMFFVGWLLVDKCSCPEWIYVPLLIVGLITGLISMVKFLIYALEIAERNEKAQNAKNKNNNEK